MPSPLLTIMMGLMFMKPFRDINRILSQLLEIANVLIALPLGGLIFMVCVVELRGNTSIDQDLCDCWGDDADLDRIG